MIPNTIFCFLNTKKHVFQQHFLNNNFHIFLNNNFQTLWPNGPLVSHICSIALPLICYINITHPSNIFKQFQLIFKKLKNITQNLSKTKKQNWWKNCSLIMLKRKQVSMRKHFLQLALSLICRSAGGICHWSETVVPWQSSWLLLSSFLKLLPAPFWSSWWTSNPC